METYFNPQQPGSFGGFSALYHHLNKQFKKKDVKHWLARQDAYTLHKPVKWHYKRRKIFTVGIDDLWQADLADLSSLAKYNDGYRYLLTCIDVFSKQAWAVPLKTKTAKCLTEAFSTLIVNRHPVHLQTDKGKEFLNATFQKYLKDHDIKFYTTENEDIKAAVVERLNRTLKSKMWRFFTHNGSLRYIDVLKDLLHSYNHTFHRTIKMTPAEVGIHNEAYIRRLQSMSKKAPQWKFNVGDKVRISKARRIFQKGYLPSWTDEIFTVLTRQPTEPPTYELEDYIGEKLSGKFYEAELQRIIKEDDVYKVDKVLKTRKRGGKTEYFVKWRGYPESFNSWVSDILPL